MGRRKKELTLTQEQIDFRNSILRGKVRAVKNAESKRVPLDASKAELTTALTNDDEIKKCFYFINNCVFWINEYVDGNIKKDILLQTARAMQENAKKLEQLLR